MGTSLLCPQEAPSRQPVLLWPYGSSARAPVAIRASLSNSRAEHYWRPRVCWLAPRRPVLPERWSAGRRPMHARARALPNNQEQCQDAHSGGLRRFSGRFRKRQSGSALVSSYSEGGINHLLCLQGGMSVRVVIDMKFGV